MINNENKSNMDNDKDSGKENINNFSTNTSNSISNFKISNSHFINNFELNGKTANTNDFQTFEKIDNNFSEKEKFISKNEFENDYTRIENIIDNNQYNIKNIKAIIFCALYIFMDGFYLNYFNFILIPFQKYYEISDNKVKMIASIIFLGQAIGSILAGFLSSKFNRRTRILTCVICISILHVFLSFIHNVIIFAIMRFLISVFQGTYMVLIFNIMAEYLPIKFRAFIMSSIWTFWNFGGIFFLLLCKFYSPNLDYDPKLPFSDQNFHLAIFQLFYLLIFKLIVYAIFLEDSPRNLILNGKIDEAKKILEYYTSNKLTDDDMKNIENNMHYSGENKFYKNQISFSMLFEKRIRKLTIIMMSVFLFFALGFYGINVATPIILDKMEKRNSFFNDFQIMEKKNSTSTNNISSSSQEEIETPIDESIDNLILIYAIGIIGNIAAGVISEFKIIGRKFSTIVFYIVGFIVCIFSILFYKNFSFWIGFSTSFIGAGYNVQITYLEEIYPTKLRDYALGVVMLTLNLGGFFGQFLFISFSKASLFFAVYAYLFFILINSVLLLFLPNDNDKHIDAEIQLEQSFEKNEEDQEVMVRDTKDKGL